MTTPKLTSSEAKKHNKEFFILKKKEFLDISSKYIIHPDWNTSKVIPDFTYENFASLYYYIQELEEVTR